MRNKKTLKKKILRGEASFRRASTTDDVVRCPYCGAIAEKYRPFEVDARMFYRLHYKTSISSGLSGSRRNSKYVLYICTECKEIFKVKKRHG
jgi:DNA-directed RNA polymerase subunit RPC12/RpoP